MRNAVETALASSGIDTSESEIAFFGGSFTAIDRAYMVSLLEAANEYAHKFKGIRISTRPDAISAEVLDVLKKYNVTSIELGAQSMNDNVLSLNNRGHSSECVRLASKLIKDNGFSLGLQMMTGLYGSSDADDLYTAKEFIKLRPDTVRIYPTVVLDNTELSTLFLSGKYNTQTLEEAVDLCAKLTLMFEEENISVIRVGLHSSDTMESKILSGAYHPAFRELCESKIYLNMIIEIIKNMEIKRGKITIQVAAKAVSKATGQRKSNLTYLKNMGYNPVISADPALSERQIIIQEG